MQQITFVNGGISPVEGQYDAGTLGIGDIKSTLKFFVVRQAIAGLGFFRSVSETFEKAIQTR